MAVSGACKTPASIPPIPANTAFPTGTNSYPTSCSNPNAYTYPKSAPQKIAGAKMPATPPAPTVIPVRTGLGIHAIKSSPIKDQPSGSNWFSVISPVSKFE